MKQSVTYWLILVSINIFVSMFTTYLRINLILPYICGYFLRKYIFRRCPAEYKAQPGEVAIVTGSSSGIGTEVAKGCLERGATVILACRNTAAAQKVVDESPNKANGQVMKLDLSDMKDIQRFVKEISAKFKHVDLVILNAGINNSQRRVTKDGFEETVGVNHLGHMYLTYLLRHLLRASKAHPRVTVVASDLHRLSKGPHLKDMMFENNYSGWIAYNHSKLLNLLFVRRLCLLWKNKINVNSAHPGTPIFTGLLSNYSFMKLPGVKTLIGLIAIAHNKSIWDGAQTILQASYSPHVLTYTGLYFENCAIVSPSKAAQDDSNEAEVWKWSCQQLGIDPDTWMLE